LSRQHNAPSPFFQAVPVELTQLSTFEAEVAVAAIEITPANTSFRVLFIFSPQKSLF